MVRLYTANRTNTLVCQGARQASVPSGIGTRLFTLAAGHSHSYCNGQMTLTESQSASIALVYIGLADCRDFQSGCKSDINQHCIQCMPEPLPSQTNLLVIHLI